MTEPSGVYAAFQTPFNDDESIDFDCLAAEIDWLISVGVSGVVMAMVSEVLRLSNDERDELAKFVRDRTAGQCALIVSVGAESTAIARRHALHAESIHADAIMAIPPISTQLSNPQLQSYYRDLLSVVSMPLVLQDASSYVGQAMEFDWQLELLNEFGRDRLYFKPEAEPILPRLRSFHEKTDRQAVVFEGSGGQWLVESYKVGISATMPGAEIADALVVLWNALTANDERIVNALNPLVVSLGELQTTLDEYLSVEKHLLVRRGLFRSARIRGPVGSLVSRSNLETVDSLFSQLTDVLDEIRRSS